MRQRISALKVMVVREEGAIPPLDNRFRGPANVASAMAHLTHGQLQESFYAFCLTTRHKVQSYQEVTRGILDAALIHPREILRPAIVEGAAAIIVAHNHPSGSPEPSPEDRAVTRQLAAACDAVGIPLLDHVILGNDTGEWVSLAPNGEERERATLTAAQTLLQGERFQW